MLKQLMASQVVKCRCILRHSLISAQMYAMHYSHSLCWQASYPLSIIWEKLYAVQAEVKVECHKMLHIASRNACKPGNGCPG